MTGEETFGRPGPAATNLVDEADSAGEVYSLFMEQESAYAAQLRERMREALSEVCAIMQEARSRGLNVSFNIGPDGFGVFRVNQIDVVRPY